MTRFNDTQITAAIAKAYHEKFLNGLVSDVLVVGAGPAGLTAAYYLTGRGRKVTLIERGLAPGGGIWGGGMAMNDVVVQPDAVPILKEFGVRHGREQQGLPVVDTVEMASALCFKTVQAGARLFNLTTLEDVCFHEGRVTGVVVNRTGISGKFHVDPVMFSAKAILDATGHDAFVVDKLRKRGYLRDLPAVVSTGEGPMDAEAGETFVVEKTGRVFPGLWVAGMSVCATFGGPRMGPIFGGMLLSGKKVAELIDAELKRAQS